MNVFLSYPVWFIILCPLIGIAVSAILYFNRSHQFSEAKWSYYLLSALRFVYVSVLVFLLLGPYVKSTQNKLEKPGVLLLVDNSESIKQSWTLKDSTEFRNNINALVTKLSSKFTVYERAFGDMFHESIDYSFSDKTTNISEALDDAFDRYAESNLASMILISDGIFNRGVDPIYSKAVGSFPIYTIALGDTRPVLDLRINNLYFNELVYLGDQFAVRMDIKSFGGNGNSPQIKLTQIGEGGQESLMTTKSFTVSDQNTLISEELIIEAKTPGINHYRVSISPIPGELNLKNNTIDFYVEVLDARQKVLILSEGSHPDIGAFKSALQSTDKYEIDFIQDLKLLKSSTPYNLVILYNIPSATTLMVEGITTWKKNSTPLLFVAGSKTSIPEFNKVQNMVQIVPKSRNSESEARVYWNTEYSAMSISDNAIRSINQFPPIQVPFADFKVSPNTKVIAFQKIGSVETVNPVILSQGNEMVFIGEGFWKWRLHEYMNSEENTVFDEIMSSLVQLVSAKTDKRKFRSKPRKQLFNENERILFDAELYDDVYKPVLKAEVKAILRSQDGKEYNYTFTPSPANNSYQLNAGFLPVNTYSYIVSTSWNGVPYKETGSFTVSSVTLEQLENTANHKLLNKLSQSTGAKMFTLTQLDQLFKHMTERDDHKPVLVSEENTRPIIELFWIFFVILSFLATEWILRKYLGVS